MRKTLRHVALACAVGLLFMGAASAQNRGIPAAQMRAITGSLITCISVPPGAPRGFDVTLDLSICRSNVQYARIGSLRTYFMPGERRAAQAIVQTIKTCPRISGIPDGRYVLPISVH